MVTYHLDTIPVWDAFHANGECPICDMEKKLENQYLDGALGGSVMEPDARIEVNEKGFCANHLRKLYAQPHRLGLALMMHTHMRKMNEEAVKLEEAVCNAVLREQSKNPLKRGGDQILQKTEYAKPVQELLANHSTHQESCRICEQIAQNMERYYFTIFHLYKKDQQFAEYYQHGKGFCYKHYAELLGRAMKELHGEKQRQFLLDTIRMQQENRERLDKELEWFTLKFDYRNGDKPWGNSRDAVERAVNKVRVRVVEQDEDPKEQNKSRK